jgi:hypothetical protein
VAALVGIDESQVETLLLSAAPDLVQQRDSAANAHIEGRTRSLEDFMTDEPDLSPPEGTVMATVVRSTPLGRAVLQEPSAAAGLRQLLGSDIAAYVTAAAHDRAVAVTSDAVLAAHGKPETESVAPIAEMNQQLIMHGLQQEMISRIGKRLGAIDVGAGTDTLSVSDLVTKAQTDLVLDAVTDRIARLNDRFVTYARESGGEFFSCYQAELRASIDTVSAPGQLGLHSNVEV